MKNILKIVFVITGAIVGAGFASGQEVYLFFFSHGIKGIIGIILSCFIIGAVISKTLKIINENNINTYNEFLDYLIKNKKIKLLINSIINIFILVTFYIMIAGFGAYLQQEYKIDITLGSAILSLLCFIILKSNVKGFVKSNEILIPILLIVITFIRNIKHKKYKFR